MPISEPILSIAVLKYCVSKIFPLDARLSFLCVKNGKLVTQRTWSLRSPMPLIQSASWPSTEAHPLSGSFVFSKQHTPMVIDHSKVAVLNLSRSFHSHFPTIF